MRIHTSPPQVASIYDAIKVTVDGPRQPRNRAGGADDDSPTDDSPSRTRGMGICRPLCKLSLDYASSRKNKPSRIVAIWAAMGELAIWLAGMYVHRKHNRHGYDIHTLSVMAQFSAAQYYPGMDMSGPMRSSRQGHRADPYHNPYGPQHSADFWSTDPCEFNLANKYSG